MRHPNCCHLVEPENVPSNVNHWAKGQAQKGFLPWLSRRMDRFGKAFVRTLMLDPEPYISEHQNRKGEVYFRVYDPGQNVCHTFDSEEAVRIWLEERHHQ